MRSVGGEATHKLVTAELPPASVDLYFEDTQSVAAVSYTHLDVYKRQLLGRIVVYKDRWGDVVTGMLGSAQVLHDRTCDVEFTIVETDYKQEISYE